MDEKWRGELESVSMVGHALAYARRGWKVLPLFWPSFAGVCSCREGGSCSSEAKHPLIPGGSKRATHDVGQIRDWWKRYPFANIGIATGETSGFSVLDIDADHDGFTSWKHLVKQHGRPEPTLVAMTGGGGKHILWKYSHGHRCLQAVRQGLDVRADGGYIVAPPSLHSCGERYQWHPQGHPRNAKLSEAPGWAAALMSGARAVGGSSRMPLPSGPIAEGSRNVSLFRLLCKCRRAGMSDEQIDDEGRSLNKKLCRPPLGDGELEKIIGSVLRYARGS